MSISTGESSALWKLRGSVRITRELFVGHGVFFGAFWVFGFNTFPDEGALELGYDIAVI